MSRITIYQALLFLLFLSFNKVTSYAQAFSFPTLQSDLNCGNFQLTTSIRIIGIKITNIYWDAPGSSNGSFAFEVVFNYQNIFTGTLPTSAPHFWTFHFALHTTNSAIGTSTLQNNISNIPVASNPGGTTYTTTTNNTYNGSASVLGFSLGQTYMDEATLALFAFDHATLTVNLPCLYANSVSEADMPLLPVELEHFEASIENSKQTFLKWSTKSEINNQYFDIERSSDAINWSSIGRTTSKAINGHSMEELNYTFYDNNPINGTNYYRLKAINFDENYDYSPIKSVNFSYNENSIVAYPNPTTNAITLQNIIEDSYLELINLQGKTLMQRNIPTSGIYELALPELPSGNYFFKITSPASNVQYKKIQILN